MTFEVTQEKMDEVYEVTPDYGMKLMSSANIAQQTHFNRYEVGRILGALKDRGLVDNPRGIGTQFWTRTREETRIVPSISLTRQSESVPVTSSGEITDVVKEIRDLVQVLVDALGPKKVEESKE